MVILPDALGELKSWLRPLKLSEPRRTLMIRFVVATVLRCGRMSASQSATAVRSQPCHRAQITRFLAREWWNKRPLLGHLQASLLELERKTGGRFVLAIDTTLCSRQGRSTENTFSTGNRQRRPCKGRRYNHKKNSPKRCHAFVCGLLITPSGLRIPFSRKYLTQEFARNRGVPHRTQAELAAELIAELPLPAGADVLVVADTAFDAEVIRDACAKRDYGWITPVNPERVWAGPKPRPKVRSLLQKLKVQQFSTVRLHPGRGALVPYRRLSPHRVGPKAKSRTFYVHGERRRVHSVAEDVLVVVSTMEKPQAGEPLHEPKLLMTNDTSLTPAQLIEWYSLRWQVELFFKELKSVLGFDHYRFRDFIRVERWVDLVLATFLYLEWSRARQLARRDLTAIQRRWWTAQRSHGLCRAVRHQSERNDLQTIGRRLKTAGGRRALARMLRNALPAEMRAAM